MINPPNNEVVKSLVNYCLSTVPGAFARVNINTGELFCNLLTEDSREECPNCSSKLVWYYSPCGSELYQACELVNRILLKPEEDFRDENLEGFLG